MEEGLEEDLFWINPCGFENDCTIISEMDKEKDLKEVVKDSIDSLKSAYENAVKLKIFLKRIHPSVDVEDLDSTPTLDFLKHPTTEFDANSGISELPVAFNILQRLAVALEQMIKDAKGNIKYLEYLEDEKRSLKNVLCSIYVLILYLGLKHLEDIKRSIMPDNLRNNKKSFKIRRDMVVAKIYADRIHNLRKVITEYYKREV